MPPQQLRPDGTLSVVVGASRSGKTSDVAQRTRNQRRLLVWDCSKGEWWQKYDCRRVQDPRELAECVKPGAKIERIAYEVPITRDSFDLFCRLAWVWLRVARGALIVDELADVTSPGKAPPAWGSIVRKGLAFGPDIFAITQRPAESDKTALGNFTQLRCFQMAMEDDERYMARHLRVDQAAIAQLAPLHWLERDRITGALRRGSVRFRSQFAGRVSAAQR